MNNNLQNIADSFTSIYLPQEIIINLILSFILGLIISVIYKFTHKGLSYSQSFMLTNIFVAVIVCMVIMIIGNSLARAFALVGALSIIRFKGHSLYFLVFSSRYGCRNRKLFFSNIWNFYNKFNSFNFT